MTDCRIIVAGASAGGIPSLKALLGVLPADLNAAVFVVQHLSPDYRSTLAHVLGRSTAFRVRQPDDGERIEPRTVYVASPDHHLLIEQDRVLVKRGPKENRFRPSIDALFRSAAYSHNSRVIGIVLSGALDDGTSGLWTIKRLGGTTIVQAPDEAEFDSMPLSALEQVEVDHCMTISEMGRLLRSLDERIEPPSSEVAEDQGRVGLEVSIAADADAFRKGIMNAGELTPLTCPECHGVLVEIDEDEIVRYRCHTGHAYSRAALLSETVEKIEQTYWIAMRSLEEASMLMDHTADSLARQGQAGQAKRFREEAEAAEAESRGLRENLLRRREFTGRNLFGNDAA